MYQILALQWVLQLVLCSLQCKLRRLWVNSNGRNLSKQKKFRFPYSFVNISPLWQLQVSWITVISLFLCVGSTCRCADLDCRFLQWLWRMGFLSPLGFLFWGDVLLTAPGQSRPVCRGVLSVAQLLHFKCLRALAELSSVLLLLSRSLKLKLSTSHPAHQIVTPVSMWAARGEMTSLIESYYQSIQSDCRETVHQDSDEEDDGNNDHNDSQDESLSQSTSSTSAIVSSNSVRFLIIIQHQLIYWLSCNIAYSFQLTCLHWYFFACKYCQCQYVQWDQ